jgi:hypothetical protein
MSQVVTKPITASNNSRHSGQGRENGNPSRQNGQSNLDRPTLNTSNSDQSNRIQPTDPSCHLPEHLGHN